MLIFSWKQSKRIADILPKLYLCFCVMNITMIGADDRLMRDTMPHLSAPRFVASAVASATVPSAPRSLPPRSSARTHCSVACMAGSTKLSMEGGSGEGGGEGGRERMISGQIAKEKEA